MKYSRSISFFMLPLVLASLACQAVLRAFQPAIPPTAQSSATPSLPTHTLTPTFIPSATFTPSPTIPPATVTPSPTVTTIPTPSALQFQVFEHLWNVVNDEYVYPDFNGLDWQAVYEEYSRRIQSGLTDEDFYAAMEEMINLLGDDHSVFLHPQEAREEDEEFAGNYNYVGIGIISILIPERKRISIINIFPGSPAEEAGLQVHDSILAVDGQPIVDENGFRRTLLRGPANSSIDLTVQTPGEEPRQVRLTRRQIDGAVPLHYEALTSAQGKRIGYILLTTFMDETIDDQLLSALQALSADGPLDGLILDNRQNSGGSDHVTSNALSYFTSGSLGEFTDRHNNTRPFHVVGADISGSADVPLVVLVGPNTISFGEIFSGVLKDQGRAYLIGESTEGNVELLSGYNLEDGSRAWIARETFRPRHNSEQDWEATGIIPDQTVYSNWDEVTLDSDPVVQAALDHLESIQ